VLTVSRSWTTARSVPVDTNLPAWSRSTRNDPICSQFDRGQVTLEDVFIGLTGRYFVIDAIGQTSRRSRLPAGTGRFQIFKALLEGSVTVKFRNTQRRC